MKFASKFYIILSLCCCLGFAQEPLADNPKVGLVLSGGGAKGLAHIGSLESYR
jgi:NTE family protein